ICQQYKNLTHKLRTPTYRIPVPMSPAPFKQVALDLVTGLPKSNDYDAILIIVNHGCSRAAIFLPCKTTITGPQIASLYLQHVYCWYELPHKVISDRDPRFTSHFGRALAKELGIQQNISTAFHPQTDGLTEWTNQWVEQYLSTTTIWFSAQHQLSLSLCYPLCLKPLNNTKPILLPSILVPATRTFLLEPRPHRTASPPNTFPPPSGMKPHGLSTPVPRLNLLSVSPRRPLRRRPRLALPPRSSPRTLHPPRWLLLPSGRRAAPLGPLPRLPRAPPSPRSSTLSISFIVGGTSTTITLSPISFPPRGMIKADWTGSTSSPPFTPTWYARPCPCYLPSALWRRGKR